MRTYAREVSAGPLGLSPAARRATPLTLAYGLVLASLYVLKPARNAMFLSQLGVDQLPYVLLLVAAVGGLFALVYGQLMGRLPVDVLVQRTFFALILMLGGFRWALTHTASPWLFYAFYVWVALYGLLTTSLVWLLANGIFTSREGRKVFGQIGSGGIAGAIVGGFFTGELAEQIGTENLLVVCMGLLAACLGLFRMLPPVFDATAAKRVETPPPALRAIASNNLLRYLALATGLIAVVAVIVDVQFNQLVNQAFDTQDAKTAFFGTFFAALSAFSFIFQLFVTPRILERLGVGSALTFLPAALGLGSIGMLFAPGLLSGMAAKGADGGFRHSVHKAASEVLFLPVPHDVKKQSKLFLDTTVDTTATGIGALAVLVLTEQLGVPYAFLSVVSIIFMAAALVVVRRLRTAYVGAFREALESRRLDLTDLRQGLAEAGAVDLLKPALRSDSSRQVLYALDLLTGVAVPGVRPELERLLDHTHPEVRKRALSLRTPLQPPLQMTQLHVLAQDSNEAVAGEALAHILDRDRENGRARIEAGLEAGGAARASALTALTLRPQLARTLLDAKRIEGWLTRPHPPQLRVQLARALGQLGHSSLDETLRDLLADGDAGLCRAAIEGLGAGRNEAWLPWLVEQLETPDHRSAVRDALIASGAASVPHVSRWMERRDLPSVRRVLPRVLGGIATQSSVEVLMAHLLDEDTTVSRAVRRAAVKLRLGFDNLRFDRRQVTEALQAAASRCSEARDALRDLEGQLDDSKATALLARSLEEAQADTRETVLDLLVLRHDPKDIERARRGFAPNATAGVRSSALELLDNVLESDARALALAVLEDTPRANNAPAPPQREVLAALAAGPNAWLRACATHLLTRH